MTAAGKTAAGTTGVGMIGAGTTGAGATGTDGRARAAGDAAEEPAGVVTKV